MAIPLGRRVLSRVENGAAIEISLLERLAAHWTNFDGTDGDCCSISQSVSPLDFGLIHDCTRLWEMKMTFA
jgi:hypothetical protein